MAAKNDMKGKHMDIPVCLPSFYDVWRRFGNRIGS